MTPNLHGVTTVLDRMAAVQSRFSSTVIGGRPLGSASSGDAFDSTLAQLGNTDDGTGLLDSNALQLFSGISAPSTTTTTTSSAVSALSIPSSTTATSAMSATSATSVDGSDIVESAKKYLGVPYVWGGTDPAVGLDCSALVQRAYADLGVNLPRTSGPQSLAGAAVGSLADARPGDLVAFGQPVNHIGIYAGTR